MTILKLNQRPGDGGESCIYPHKNKFPASASQPNLTSFHLADFKHWATAIRHSTAGEKEANRSSEKALFSTLIRDQLRRLSFNYYMWFLRKGQLLLGHFKVCVTLVENFALSCLLQCSQTQTALAVDSLADRTAPVISLSILGFQLPGWIGAITVSGQIRQETWRKSFHAIQGLKHVFVS